MDFYISIYTLKKFENIVNNYKRRVLKDFYETHRLDLKTNINYQDFENSYIEGEIKENITSKEIIFDKNKCHALVLDKKSKRQCRHSKKIGNFCKKHYENHNCGIIDI